MVASVIRASLLLVGLLLPSALAAPTVPTVQTPHGVRPAANVHKVPEGGKISLVGDEIHLLDATGTIVHIAQNDYSPVHSTPTSDAVAPEETGWVAYASWYNSGSPISSFLTTWTVPATPSTNHGQTVFLFNSIEPASFNAILQPVLQWGGSAAGGGAYWAIASWYVTGSSSYYTNLVTVSVGQVLNGAITLSSSSGSSYNYLSTFTNIGGAALALTGSPQLVWATETLEAYGITANSDYPAGATTFSGINIKNSAGTAPGTSWSAVSDTADGVITTVAVNGATNAVATINY